MTPGLAGTILLGHTTLTKMLMTILFRGPGSKAAKMGADNWVQVKDKLQKDPLYEIMSACQLNEAEYAGPFIAALFFLSLNNVEAPIAASLAVFGQVAYYWPRFLFANHDNFNNGFPFYVPGALARYASLFMLTYACYNTVNN
jgi:hypothetical protein